MPINENIFSFIASQRWDVPRMGALNAPQTADIAKTIEKHASAFADAVNQDKIWVSQDADAVNQIKIWASQNADAANSTKILTSRHADAMNRAGMGMSQHADGMNPAEASFSQDWEAPGLGVLCAPQCWEMYTHNMRNDAHFQFHTEFRDLVIRSIPEQLKIAPQFEAYHALYEREDEALKKINKSALTAKINYADKARDMIWHGLVEMNKACLKHFDPDVQDAAKRLKIVIDTYGKVAQKPLNEQTSAIYNILQDFEGKYAPDIAAVGLAQWVAELKARNLAFRGLVKERFEESAARIDIVLKEARAELNAAYREIVERINALIIVEGAANYEAFVRMLNVIIAKYSATTGRAKAAPKMEPEENVA